MRTGLRAAEPAGAGPPGAPLRSCAGPPRRLRRPLPLPGGVPGDHPLDCGAGGPCLHPWHLGTSSERTGHSQAWRMRHTSWSGPPMIHLRDACVTVSGPERGGGPRAQWPQLKDESRLEIRQAEKQHAHACDRAWLISSHHYFCYFNTTYLISDHPHNGATMILICTTVSFYF